jgi:hypothetical protein
MLNNGNLKDKSRLLKYYIFDLPNQDQDFKIEYEKYDKSILRDASVKSYTEINRFLHDGKILKYSTGEDIIFEMELWDEKEKKSFIKKMYFIGGKVLSLNKVLKSGKIARFNKIYQPKDYLYDEIYFENNRKIITIICTIKDNSKSGIHYPLLTISFNEIKVTD